MTLKKDELLLEELASAPATPGAGKWSAYFKSDGLYIVDDAGTETGPFGTGGGSGGSPSVCDGRLTLETGVPVSITDQLAKTTVYFTPFIGDKIGLYNGATWDIVTFAELSLSLSGYTANKNYDIWVYNNSGTATLESTIWTDDTTRATALVRQDGILCKTGTLTRRYVGTIRITGTTGQCESSAGGTSQSGGKQFLWNYYNRVPRLQSVIDTTDTWSYTTATWRQANNAAGNKCEFVVGVAEDSISTLVLATVSLVSNSATSAKVGVGVDSTSAPSGLRQGGYNATASNIIAPCSAGHQFTPVAGYHYVAWIEYGGDGTCTFLGDNSNSGVQAGMSLSIRG